MAMLNLKKQAWEEHGSDVRCSTLGQTTGKVAATGGMNGKVNVWALGKRQPVRALTAFDSSVSCVSFSQREDIVAAGGDSGELRVWQLGNSSILRSGTFSEGASDGDSPTVTALAFHPQGGRCLACASSTGSIMLWDLKTGNQAKLSTPAGAQSPITLLTWNAKGTRLASASRDGSVRLWDVTGACKAELVLAQATSVAATAVAFHDTESSFITVGYADGSVRMWRFVPTPSLGPGSGSAVGSVVWSQEGSGDGAGVLSLVWLPRAHTQQQHVLAVANPVHIGVVQVPGAIVQGASTAGEHVPLCCKAGVSWGGHRVGLSTCKDRLLVAGHNATGPSAWMLQLSELMGLLQPNAQPSNGENKDSSNTVVSAAPRATAAPQPRTSVSTAQHSRASAPKQAVTAAVVVAPGRSSPVACVPAQRDAPVGLEPKAFLQGQRCQDAAALRLHAMEEHTHLHAALTQRLTRVRAIRSLWAKETMEQALEQLAKFEDASLTFDIFNNMPNTMLKSIPLVSCRHVLAALKHALCNSPYENHMVMAMDTVKELLTLFGKQIRSLRESRKATQGDGPRAQRARACSAAYDILTSIQGEVTKLHKSHSLAEVQRSAKETSHALRRLGI